MKPIIRRVAKRGKIPALFLKNSCLMKSVIDTPMGRVTPGMRIKILEMFDNHGLDERAREYNGRIGDITMIDDAGQLFGTWGGLAVLPDKDVFIVLTDE